MIQDKLAAANTRHAELTAQIKGTMAEYEGKETTAEETARLEAMFTDLDAIGSEIKGYVTEAETKADQLARLDAADRFRTESAGKLPGMGLGGSAAVRAKGVDPRTGIQTRAGWIGAEVKGEFVPVYDEDTFGRSPELKATASPDYHAAYRRYLSAKADRDIPARDWEVLQSAFTKSLTEGTDTAGGFLVPVQMVAQLLTRRPGMTVLAGKTTTINATSDRVIVPRLAAASTDATMYSSAVAVTDVGETPSESTGLVDPVFEQVGITMHTLKVMTKLSRHLVADAAFSVESLLAEEFGRAVLLGKDDRFLTGTGIAQPLGIVNDSTITTINSGSASALTADGIKSLVYGLAAQYQANSTIVLSLSALAAIRKLKDGDGRYLWDAGYGDVSGGVPSTIEGRPYLVTDFLDSVTASAIPMFIGDLSAYWIVERQGFAIEVLRELYAPQNMIGYQGFARYSGAVVNPQAFRTHTVSA